MQIISRHSDYYDYMQSYGIDKELKFHRRKIEYEFNLVKENKSCSDWSIDHLYYHMSEYELQSVSVNILGFCSKLYPFIMVQHYKKANDTINKTFIPVSNEVFYSYDQYSQKHYGKSRSIGKYAIKSDLEEKFELAEKYFNYWAPRYWVNTDSPYFVLLSKDYNHKNPQSNIIIECPNLAEYQFQKVKSAEEAYQEIYQFLGNIKTRNKPEIKELNNKEKIVKAGFDTKISFRKRN